MQGNKIKKGYLTSAWKKATLGLVAAAAVTATVLPPPAAAQSVQQAQAQLEMANCRANYVNQETNLSRDRYDNYAQRAARQEQITAQYNYCASNVQAQYGYSQPYQSQPYYQNQPYQSQPYYSQPPVQGNDGWDTAGAILGGVILDRVINHAFHHRDRDDGHRGWGHRGGYRHH